MTVVAAAFRMNCAQSKVSVPLEVVVISPLAVSVHCSDGPPMFWVTRLPVESILSMIGALASRPWMKVIRNLS